MGVLKVMDHSGDTAHSFDPANATEVSAAMAVFDDLVKQGHTAYKRTGNGTGEVIRKFDGTADEIVVRPRVIGG